MDPYLGQIFMFGGNYAPRNYAFCDGQVLPIAQYQGLFSLLGTAFGGDGQYTFGLPDLEGRMPRGTGQGAGLPNVARGQTGGLFRTSLVTSQMPAHTHTATLSVDTQIGGSPFPMANGSIAAAPAGGQSAAFPYEVAEAHISAPTPQDPACTAFSEEGFSAMFTHYPPLTVLNYVIVIVGLFPSHN